MILAFVHATRKLTHYFQAHTVWVLIEHPLQFLLRMSYFIGRIAKWGTRLGTFDIRYKPRNSIKGQVLADFVAEFTPSSGTSLIVCQVTIRQWKVYVDGASNSRGLGVGVVLESPGGMSLEKSLRLGFRASNNKAEYEALIARLRAAQKFRVEEVDVFSDSWLMVNQIDGSFKARD